MYEGYLHGLSTPEDVDYARPGLPDDTKGAAISVAFLLVASVIVLTVMKRSGFRAMVAVGRS